MGHYRDQRPTQPESGPTSSFSHDEAVSGHFRIEKHDTMWEARLILSTLDPRDPAATRLRAAIRQGKQNVVQLLLDEIFEERSRHADAPAPPAEVDPQKGSPRPVVRSTMLPPASARRSG